jgi:hypothetical protein
MSIQCAPRLVAAVVALAALAGCASPPEREGVAEPAWRSLFDGRSLEGWTPKIRGQALGDNYRDTFRIRDGVIAVSYDRYDSFSERFGHLFHRLPFRAYRLRLDYRFLADGTPADTPDWAQANSGVMIYAQDPASMTLDQSFPVSVEAQFLGPAGAAARTSGNMCSPGTNVAIDGALEVRHCINSTVPAPPNGEWVRFEVEVTPAGVVTQKVNGQTAIVYSQVQLDPEARMADSRPLIDAANGRLALDGGYIALQSEGAPIEFRDIEILELDVDQLAQARPISE